MTEEQRLKDMREDLEKLITMKCKEKGLSVSGIKARQTLITEPEIEDFNTSIDALKNFGLTFNVFVNLDDTYDYNDIKALSTQFVRYLESNLKKDAFLLGSANVMYKQKHPDWDDGLALNMAIEDLKDMKRNE